jgi:hypothetical protein
MYKVIKLFTDLQDSDHLYEVGDEYPRLGLNPGLARIEELKGPNNKQGVPLIEEVPDLEADEEKEAEEKPAEEQEEEKAEPAPKEKPAEPKKSAAKKGSGKKSK